MNRFQADIFWIVVWRQRAIDFSCIQEVRVEKARGWMSSDLHHHWCCSFHSLGSLLIASWNSFKILLDSLLCAWILSHWVSLFPGEMINRLAAFWLNNDLSPFRFRMPIWNCNGFFFVARLEENSYRLISSIQFSIKRETMSFKNWPEENCIYFLVKDFKSTVLEKRRTKTCFEHSLVKIFQKTFWWKHLEKHFEKNILRNYFT